MAAEAICQMSLGEFIAWERKQETRHEYIDGEIYDMAGGSNFHSDIGANMMIALGTQLLGSGCRPRGSDMAVLVGTRYVYPDLSIGCGKPEFYQEGNSILTNPIIVIEVLSDSIEAKDRGRKLSGYQQIPSLQMYVLVSQHQPIVECYQRYNTTQWLYTAYVGSETVVPFDCIECELKLTEIYRDIDFSQHQSDESP